MAGTGMPPVAGHAECLQSPTTLGENRACSSCLRARCIFAGVWERRSVGRFRQNQILAGAAVVFLVAAPLCAVAQEAMRTEAGITDNPKLIEIPTAAREQPPATDPLATLDPADRAIAERIRDNLQPKPNRIFANENELAAVEAFYQKRNYAPLWLDKGAENARSRAVIARLKNADTDGLDPADYKTPSLAGLASDALAEAELTLTQAVLTYARHVQAGRAPHRMVRDSNIGLPQKAPD